MIEDIAGIIHVSLAIDDSRDPPIHHFLFSLYFKKCGSQISKHETSYTAPKQNLCWLRRFYDECYSYNMRNYETLMRL